MKTNLAWLKTAHEVRTRVNLVDTMLKYTKLIRKDANLIGLCPMKATKRHLESTLQKKAFSHEHIAMYLIREFTHLTFKEIGQHFVDKAHTTVFYACTIIERLLKAEPITHEGPTEICRHIYTIK